VLTLGILALQGDFEKHRQVLERLQIPGRLIRKPSDLEGISGLILPGGESTTIGRLMVRYGLDVAIRERVEQGMAVYGTCAGMILLAREIEGSTQERLGLMNIGVRRNAFGRQIESFEVDLPFKPLKGGLVRAVFIRAPVVSKIESGVRVLSEYEDKIVAVQQDRLLATAFHPELTDDTRVHQYFLSLCQKPSSGSSTG